MPFLHPKVGPTSNGVYYRDIYGHIYVRVIGMKFVDIRWLYRADKTDLLNLIGYFLLFENSIWYAFLNTYTGLYLTEYYKYNSTNTKRLEKIL